MHIKIFSLKDSLLKDFIFLTSILLLYCTPLLLFGVDRMEDYKYNHFSALINAQNFFSPFIFFYDLIGPGTKLPLGSGLNYFFFPTIFIQNIKVFYFTTFFLGFYLQLNFLKKIFKLLKFKNIYILCIFYALNIEILYQILEGDSIKTFFSVSCFPIIFYYLLKFFKFKKKLHFYKLIFISGYIILNTHEAYMLTSSLGFLLFVFFNNSSFLFKKKYLYMGAFLFLCAISENVYRLLIEFNQYSGVERPLVYHDYDLKHYASGIVFILKFFEDFFQINFPFLSNFKPSDNLFLPFGGVIFYFSLFTAVKLIIKKESQNIYYVNYIFLILFFLSLLDYSNTIISAPWVIRDINNFFSIIIFGKFLTDIKYTKISKSIMLFALVATFLHTFSSINYKLKDSNIKKYNFFNINKNFEVSDIFLKFSNNINLNSQYGKTYLSDGIWQMIQSGNSKIFNDSNVFYYNDLIKYKIFPFNSKFKNASKIELRRAEKKMYSDLKPNIKEINDHFFFNIFNISNLMLLESEKNKINLNKYEKIFSIKTNKDSILYLKLKDRRIVVINDEIQNFTQIDCKSKILIDCLQVNKNLFTKSNKIQISRLSLNKYEIKNSSTKSYKVLLPFLYDKAWKTKGKKIKKTNGGLMFYEIMPNSNNIIFYRDYPRIIFKILSIFSFILLFLLAYRSN